MDSKISLDSGHLAGMFKALGHPHRFRLFARLATCCKPGVLLTEEEERACVGQVGEGLDISSSTLSHHLKELRQAGLIKMKKHGQLTECWVEPEILQQLSEVFSNLKGLEKCC